MTTQTLTLTNFLLERIAEVEASALEAQAYEQSDRDGPRLIHACDYLGPELADHIARWSPDRVLAECEAKRRIVAWCSEYERVYIGNKLWDIREQDFVPGELIHRADSVVLRFLALPYADHPDYRQEWKP